jgi:hypothetical protein
MTSLFRTLVRLSAVPWLLLVVTWTAGTWPGFTQEPAKIELKPGSNPAIHLPLKGTQQDLQALTWTGLDAAKHVRFEPAGLRITLPADYPKDRFTGLSMPIVIKGDFEVTVGFEVLAEPAPEDAGPQGTRLSLAVVLDTPEKSMARLARRTDAKGGKQFSTWTVLGKKAPYAAQPTNASVGRLRMVRTGAALSYYVSEGIDAPFLFVEQRPLGAGDVKEIQLTGTTGGGKVGLDGRFTDLRIRAGSLSAELAAASDDAISDPTAPRRWGRLELLGTLLTLLLLIAAGLWLYARQRRDRKTRSVPAVPNPVILCGRCGKKLTVKSELAGKKVKCVQCGEVMRVPPTGPETGASAAS